MSTATAQSVTIKLGGKDRQLYPMTLGDLDALQLYLRRQAMQQALDVIPGGLPKQHDERLRERAYAKLQDEVTAEELNQAIMSPRSVIWLLNRLCRDETEDFGDVVMKQGEMNDFFRCFEEMSASLIGTDVASNGKAKKNAKPSRNRSRKPST